jgi:hypothetical protein
VAVIAYVPGVLSEVVKLAPRDAGIELFKFPFTGVVVTVPVRGVPLARKTTAPVGATP